MISINHSKLSGILLSGGLDSSILLAHLLEQGRRIQPFYIRSDVVWQREELNGITRFLAAVETQSLKPLVVLDLPLGDLYRDHWSMTGRESPGADSPDDAVFLPGRNALLVIKAALWCQLHSIGQLALATLCTSPFDDATEDFFADLQTVLDRSGPTTVRIDCPFASLDKRAVMQLGRNYPLEMTFSCISPIEGLHCGRCNKCAERQLAFRLDGRIDKTRYATASPR